MRFAHIINGVVDSVVDQDSAPISPGTWIACGNACPGWTYDGTSFTPPAPTPPPAPTALPAFQFYRALTAAERIAIRALAASDPLAADFMHTLDNAIASATPVSKSDPDLVAGMNYLSTQPAGSPCITPARVAALMS